MILVTGATGSIGQYLVHHLKNQGAKFKALVRDEAKGRALGCEYVVGDFDKPDTLRAAFEGIDRLFLNVTPSESMARQLKTAIDIAKAAGVSRAVPVSSPGASMTSKLKIGRWHGEIEEHLQASGLEWSILRPGTFMQNLLGAAPLIKSEGKIIGGYKDGRAAFIDCYDIAACGAVLLTGNDHVGKTFVLTGREALSYPEVAQKFSAKLGKPVTYVDLPVEQVVASAKAKGTPAALAEEFGQFMNVIASGYAARTTQGIKEITGREPRTLDQFLDDNLQAFR